jgi:hypothetical protein
MTPRRPKGWSQSSNTSCNANPKYFGYDTRHLKSSTTRYLNSSTTRNLNLNLNSSTHQESESELFPEQGISSYRDKLVSSRRIGSGARDSFHTLCNCCCCVYKLLKEKESKIQEGIWIVSVWTERDYKIQVRILLKGNKIEVDRENGPDLLASQLQQILASSVIVRKKRRRRRKKPDSESRKQQPESSC